MVNKTFFKNPILQVIVVCLLMRIILFSLYGNKVTECPDSWSFNHFYEQMCKKKAEIVSFIFAEKTKTISPSNNDYLSKKIKSNKPISFVGERSPSYPLVMFVCGGKYKTVLFQFLIGILTAVFWYKTLLKLKFSIKSSFIITIILQSYLSLFIYETFILVETTVLFLISIIFYFLADGYLCVKKTIKHELFLSFLIGFLVLVKPFYILLPCIIIGFLFLKDLNFKSLMSRKLLILLFPFLVYFGWSYVVKSFTGYFVSTTYFGLNKSQNCVYFAEKGPKKYDWIMKPYVKHRDCAIKENKDVAMSIWYAINSGEFKDKNLTFPQLSNELGNYASATIKNNFSDYLYQVVTKSWFDFWKPFDTKLDNKFDNKYAEYLFLKVYVFQNSLLLVFKFTFLAISLFYFYNYFKFKIFNFEFIVCTTIWTVSILQSLVTYGENARFSFPFEYLMVIVVLSFIRNYRTINSNLKNTLNIF
ncbi:hypothetical protein [Flavobacterium sp.]|uniref:hypothetical protein n=1 Tax=Flavobacterium sp. TaxID=239 RepID=UPI0037507955